MSYCGTISPSYTQIEIDKKLTQKEKLKYLTGILKILKKTLFFS